MCYTFINTRYIQNLAHTAQRTQFASTKIKRLMNDIEKNHDFRKNYKEH